ncbi:MAG: class I SAM-dependent methyltransferase [Thaumarchaeota archaeon]|nr:class I SAM-dependent methyltransferase [Nitrososphaerota archaeon]
MSKHSQRLASINPVDVLLWTFRRNEDDVVNLYDSLSSLMQISTEGNMLNFGYWDDDTVHPHKAQVQLCKRIADMAELNTARNVLDVGSGFSEPATIWKTNFPHIKMSCLNVNRTQLGFASSILKENSQSSHQNHASETINLINSTATKFPFADKSMDRIIALESAQHFKPFSEFVSESRRVLKENGILALAVPVMSQSRSLEMLKLGILSFTWSSEHHGLEDLKKAISDFGFRIQSVDLIGSKVYEPLANYYVKNRKFLRPKILERYPSYVEKILFRSLLKMREVSESRTIDYVLLKSVA